MGARVDATAKQLPGSLLSSTIDGIKVIPHLLGGGSFLMSPVTDLYIGPMFFYKNTFSRDTLVAGIEAGHLEAGIRMDLDYPKMWFGSSYRLGGQGTGGVITGMYGIQIVKTDTTDTRSQMATFLDLNFGFAYPLNNSVVFGPKAEVGLTMSFGRVGSDRPDVDTIGRMDGAFWVNNGNMNTHRERHIQRVMGKKTPSGFFAETEVGAADVDLHYEWDDNMYLYKGKNFAMFGDTAIANLGTEWVGMDHMNELLVNEVIREALKPIRKEEVANPDSLEPLQDLVGVGIGCRLQFDELAADFGAEGVTYGGELGFNNKTRDSLIIPFIYGERDTVVKIIMDQPITNLELACLKLYALQLRLDYELDKHRGETYAFVREEDNFETGDKKLVFVDKPIVIPNNPNQKPFQRTFVHFEFIRIDGWEPIITKTKKVNPNKTRRKERQSKRFRNRFRDPVVDDEE
ncbi:MAG: hypothetical protein AAF570_04035 [Bacteroidota bacterium]